MAAYKDEKICELINKLESEELVLPAMQRDFVWPVEKICDLFESIIRDYPIGTFLFWDIGSEVFGKYTFNKFMNDVHEHRSNDLVRGEKASVKRDNYIAVLDGQQRITSIYIGLKGCYRRHIKTKFWNNPDDPTAFEKLFLCIDLLHMPSNEDDKYRFAFKQETEIGINQISEEGEKQFWVKVSEIYENCNLPDFEAYEYIEEKEQTARYDEKSFQTWDVSLRKQARQIVGKLKEAFYVRPVVNYYPAVNLDLGQVVEIFVRVNSGGEKLNASDLMLSVASAAHLDTMGDDFHVKIQEAIECVNEATTSEDGGFKADQDTILTTGLMAIGASSLSLKKPENYEVSTLNKIIDKWDEIVGCLCSAVRYYEYLGFETEKLSKNYIMSLAYYFFLNGLDDDHFKAQNKRAKCDRILVRQWTIRAIINGLFNYGTRNILARIRDCLKTNTQEYFPLDRLFNLVSKVPLSITETQITEDILTMKYKDVRIAPILRELSKDDSLRKLTVDHIWPQDLLKSKKAIKKLYVGISKEELDSYLEYCNMLPNLQLLTPNENSNKGNMEFKEWVELNFEIGDSYFGEHFIPLDTSFAFDNFIDFFNKRRELLKAAIEKALPKSFEEIVGRYRLPIK